MSAPKIEFDDNTYLLVLTGAGVSAESGIPTFRDAGGLWEKHRVEDVASPDGFRSDPALVWRFYSQRRSAARDCRPNAGHAAIAAVERRLGDRFLLATQNIDGLHSAAGSERVVEIHGNLYKSRCSMCDRPPFQDDEAYPEGHVPAGGATREGSLRCSGHTSVWFGERLDPAHLQRVEAFMQKAATGRFVFLAVGTSGAVQPAAGFVDVANRLGATTWLVNADPPANASSFAHFAQGRSGEILPGLLGS
ncbi:MAG: NAD-dependent deacylase [Polyangiaceae bacterium]